MAKFCELCNPHYFNQNLSKFNLFKGKKLDFSFFQTLETQKGTLKGGGTYTYPSLGSSRKKFFMGVEDELSRGPGKTFKIAMSRGQIWPVQG